MDEDFTFTLGDKKFPSKIFYAPLAGVSDFPFRRMSARFKPGLMYTEMIKSDALYRLDSGTFHILDFDETMRPIGAQICGSNPFLAGKAARYIEDLGFDVVDLNCGCPVDKVTKDGSGSGMLKTPFLIGEVIESMVSAVKIPVTLKIRSGWDEDSIHVEEITKIAESAGAKAICVHGRTREQGYKGPSNWEHIKTAKAAAKEMKVIGNGDLFDALSVKRMFEETKCDAVLIARGTMGAPWIGEEARDLLLGKNSPSKTFAEVKKYLTEHFEELLAYYPEKKAIIDMRRVGTTYFKKAPNTSAFRGAICRATSSSEIYELIDSFHPELGFLGENLEI